MCGNGARAILRGHHGYSAATRFDVLDCSSCDTRFAWPMRADTAVYEQIYAAADRVPGYGRYKRLQALAMSSPRILEDLAATEDVYWGVSQALSKVARPGHRVLEVGSGLGYLTHAMRQAGLNAQGLDLSEAAVRSAVSNFGPFFRCGTLDSMSSEAGGFDCVVATELIEHLEAPQQFVDQALRLLRPGGTLILTTPNKDIYPTHWAWHTDPAPVHLWWFSRSSLRRMAWASGTSISFVDFVGFYAGRARRRVATKPATFDGDGKVIFKDSLVNTVARALMARWPSSARWIGRIFLARLSRTRGAVDLGRQGLCHCAIFRVTAQ